MFHPISRSELLQQLQYGLLQLVGLLQGGNAGLLQNAFLRQPLAVSVPMSAAMMLFSALVRFVIWLFMTLVAAVNWFEPAPILPRRVSDTGDGGVDVRQCRLGVRGELRSLLAMLMAVGVVPLVIPRFESLTLTQVDGHGRGAVPEESLI